MRARFFRFIGLALLAHAAAGCVAHLHEERLFGAARPRDDGAPEVVPQREPGEVELGAAMHGSQLDVAVAATTACREVAVTSRVQDVSIRRSFADSSQELNGALALLAATAVGALQLSAEQIDCPSGSACWSAMTTSEYTVVAMAAVPIGFLIYNALRVRDGRELAVAAPEIREGPWRTCSRAPLAGEAVSIRLPHAEFSRVTDESGHAVFDLADYASENPKTSPLRIVVQRVGSPNAAVDWTRQAPEEAAPPQADPPPEP